MNIPYLKILCPFFSIVCLTLCGMASVRYGFCTLNFFEAWLCSTRHKTQAHDHGKCRSGTFCRLVIVVFEAGWSITTLFHVSKLFVNSDNFVWLKQDTTFSFQYQKLTVPSICHVWVENWGAMLFLFFASLAKLLVNSAYSCLINVGDIAVVETLGPCKRNIIFQKV